ncbi:hypothetical protein BDV35DRAFT_399173, partial [Aspergillus flavus]
MDLFSYNPRYRVWICVSCQYALCPQRLESHLRRQHAKHPTAATAALRQAALTAMLQRPWLDPAKEPCVFPTSSSFLAPGLPVFPGLGCTHCEYACRSPYTLRNHIVRTHPETRPGRLGSRQPKGMESLGSPVYCQRFFVGGAGSVFFEIQSSAQAKRLLQKPDGMSRVAFIQAQANLDLDCDLAADQADDQQIVKQRDSTEIPPWLELTQWPKYLHGHSFPAVAALAALPHERQEPLLVQFSQSLTRLVDRAYRTIEDRRVNEFDQIRIDTFLQRPGIWDRPIQIHLKPSTYQRYRQ